MKIKSVYQAVSLLLIILLFAIEAAIPFNVPFDVTPYDDHLEAISSLDGDQNSGAVAYWRSDENNVFLGLAASANYVGFGLNEKGPGMEGADIVVCKEYSNGIISVADYYAPHKGIPEVDASQDWVTIRSGRITYEPLEESADACPQGYTWKFNQCYKVSTTTASWLAADQACKADGGSLAKITSAAENKFVFDLAMGGGQTEAKLWFGGKEQGPVHGETYAGKAACEAGTSFVWPDGSNLNYVNWQVNEPRCSCSQGQCNICTYMGYSSYDKDKWHSANCYWDALRYVCAQPVKPGTQEYPLEDFIPKLPITWCEISRSRLTCDPKHDVQLGDLDLPYSSLLAWSPEDATNDALLYHGPYHRRNIPSFSFTSLPVDFGIPNDANTMVLYAPDETVPAASGSYVCSYHILPIPNNVRYHIVSYSVLRDYTTNDAIIYGLQHHVDLNRCTKPLIGYTDGQTVPCEFAMVDCSEVFLNQGPKTLPSDEGIPIGQGAVTHVVISRHFYNPTNRANVRDTGTGYRLVYTPTLRPKELGQITIGTTQINVPANTYGYTVSAQCSSVCTTRLSAVKVSQVFFHMHGHGKSSTVRLIRNNKELEPLTTIDPWESSQASRAVNREILPGDILILECVFDNDLNKPITYGDAIDQEMCFAFLTVIGQPGITTCIDFPDGIGSDVSPGCEPIQNIWHSNYPLCNQQVPWNSCADLGDARNCGGNIEEAACYATGDCTWSSSTCVPGEAFPDMPRYGAPLNSGTIDFEPYNRNENENINCDQNIGDPITVAAIEGRCYDTEIIGSRDFGHTNGFKVSLSWTTNCASQTVSFVLEMNSWDATPTWIGLGIHDAGSAAEPIPFPATRMNGADIIQASAHTNSLRDAVGIDYNVPQAKNTAVAILESTEVANGRLKIKFNRPFVSPEGVSFVPSRFIWLLCAFNYGSSHFDTKHSYAYALTTARISLFGGIPESVRYAVTDTSTTNSPTSPNSPTSLPTSSPPSNCQPHSSKISFGDTNGMDITVSWIIDCSSKTVQFVLGMNNNDNTPSWLALGIHDGGSVSNPKPFPSASPMNDVDIIQASADTNSLKDSKGIGYTIPRTKTSPVAVLNSAEVANGRLTITFTRPFQSLEGISISEDRLIYLVCAYNSGSSNFNSKHTRAYVLDNGTPISLFTSTSSPTTSSPTTSSPTTSSPTTSSPTTSSPTTGSPTTGSPTTGSPTPFPTEKPTWAPTTPGTTPYPTMSPTTSSPTMYPTTSSPTTSSPTTSSPTTSSPTTLSPTEFPTEKLTWAPTTPGTTPYPTSSPTTLSPTEFPISSPTTIQNRSTSPTMYSSTISTSKEIGILSTQSPTSVEMPSPTFEINGSSILKGSVFQLLVIFFVLQL